MLITVVEEAYSAIDNMNRDMEMLEIAQEYGAPVLRLYSWSVPTITLGKLQKASDIIDLKKTEAAGVVVLNRPTGGRAVLHEGDFTYSLSIPDVRSDLLGKSVSQTYESIAGALRLSLKNIGIDTELSKREVDRESLRGDFKKPCFISPTKNELLVCGRKLIGSAQLRHKMGVIQHGSMPLTKEFINLPDFELCNQEERAWRKKLLENESISLFECTEEKKSFEDISAAFIKGFADHFSLNALALPDLSNVQEAPAIQE